MDQSILEHAPDEGIPRQRTATFAASGGDGVTRGLTDSATIT